MKRIGTKGRPHGSLGPTALRILALVQARPRGLPVTYLDLCAELGSASFTIARHLDHLRSLGLLTWDRGCVRTLRATCKFLTPDQLMEEPTDA